LIKSKLRERGIRDSLITSAMNSIDKAVYFDNLTHLCSYKNTLIKESNTQKKKFKLAQYLLSKGYESNLIWEVINDLFNESDSE